MIFDHIRKKSKDFPTLMTSKAMDSSYRPLILTKTHNPINQFTLSDSEFHGDSMVLIDSESTEGSSESTDARELSKLPGDAVILIDLEPTETSPRFTSVISSSIETEGQRHNNNPRSSSKVLNSGLFTEISGAVNGRSDDRKFLSDNLCRDVLAVGCKRAFPSESNLASDRDDDRQYHSFGAKKLFDFHRDGVTRTDSKPIEISSKFTNPTSSSIEAEGQCSSNNSRNLSSVIYSELSPKFAWTVQDRSENRKLLSNNLLKDIQPVGCKRAFPSEPNPAPDRQVDQHCLPHRLIETPSEVSFLGFTSIFSFLQ